jgi:hypothetical protein
MHRKMLTPCGLASLGLLLAALPARADEASDPLRLVPQQVDLVVKAENPLRGIEAVTQFKVFRELLQLETVREYYDSTTVRRLFQMVGYLERQLGSQWPDLLDRLAGGGAVVAAKAGGEPGRVLVVIQGRDAPLLHKFFTLGLEILGQELARQESKERIEKSAYHGIETVHVGKNFCAAVVGSALVLSNQDKVLKHALDLHLGKGKSMAGLPAIAEAQKLLPPKPLAWLYFNFDVVHNAPQAKEIFAQPRNDTNLTVLFGGWLDVARRSPYLCAGVYREKDGFLTTIRMPKGRDGMPAELAVHIPPADRAGTLPVLEPKGVVFSTSFYLDLSKFWENRKQLFNAQQVKTFEDFDKQSAPFLLGNHLSKLFARTGTHFRFVVTHDSRPGSLTSRELNIPLAGALVVDMRDPGLGKSLEGIIRGVALLGTTQVKIKLVEEKRGETTIVSYNIGAGPSPKSNNPYGNITNPCFAAVGNQFMVASSLELGRQLVDALQKEGKKPAAQRVASAAVQTRLYSVGGAELLRGIEDQLLAQAILNQALSPDEAKVEVARFLSWLRRLGVLAIEENYSPTEFRYDIRYSTAAN